MCVKSTDEWPWDAELHFWTLIQPRWSLPFLMGVIVRDRCGR